MATPTAIVAYLALFITVGVLFLLVNLVVGRFVRPKDPHQEKLEIYECGEPTIGTSFVQFDLRFYVVALVFIVFDAEVAFLFPAATVFGKQAQLTDDKVALVASAEVGGGLTPAASGLFQELGVESPSLANVSNPEMQNADAIRKQSQQFLWYTFWAVLLFFLILFVGFAYEWKTGAFDWVRAVQSERFGRAPPAEGPAPIQEPVLAS